MSRSFPPPPVRPRPLWTATSTVPMRRVPSAPTPIAVTPPPADLDRADRFVTAPDAVVITTSQPRERRPLRPLPVEAPTEATSAPEAVAATPLAPPVPEAPPAQAPQAPSGDPIEVPALITPEATQAPVKAAPEVVTVKRRHKPGPAERRRLKAARDAAKSAGKPFDNTALLQALAVPGKGAPAPEAPKAAPVTTSATSKPVSSSAVTQAAENRITLLRGQLVNDCDSLANTAKSIGRRIKAGETPRSDGEFGLICRAMDARCTALYELLLLTRTR